MRKILLIVASFALLLVLLVSNISVTYAQNGLSVHREQGMTDGLFVPGQYSASLDNLLVVITGLDEGDTANLNLMLESASQDSEAILKKTVIGNRDKNNVIDMSCFLKDGYYQLSINAPDKYFRKPKGWLFMVSDSQLINPQGKSVAFKLVSPEDQKYRPFRGPINNEAQSMENVSHEPPSEPPSIMMEWMLSLSAPAKQPVYEDVIDSTGYHYFGYYSTLDCPGIWGQFTVVDTGVRHGATGEMTNDRIYAARDISGAQHWMEIGWAEVNWQPDVRYMYEFDYTYYDWRLWSIPETPLEVALKSYGSNTWYAMYMYNGSWYTMAYEDIGFTEADYMFNSGEVYTGYGDHPSFPSATTDISKLYISNSWVNWDWQRWATTSLLTCDTYDTHTSTSYYNFYIHKH